MLMFQRLHYDIDIATYRCLLFRAYCGKGFEHDIIQIMFWLLSWLKYIQNTNENIDLSLGDAIVSSWRMKETLCLRYESVNYDL